MAASYRLAVAATLLSVCRGCVVDIAAVLSFDYVFSLIIYCRRLTDADERFGHHCLTPLDVGSRHERYFLVHLRWSCDIFAGFYRGWAPAMFCSLARPCVSSPACLRAVLDAVVHFVSVYDLLQNV